MQQINILLTLPGNIFEKINFLKQDYLGLNLDLSPLLNFILGFIISTVLIVVSYLIGRKIINYIFKIKQIENIYLINIAIGYITIATGVAILGFFSILNPLVISAYIIFILLVSFYPYKDFFYVWKKIYKFLLNTIKSLGKNKMILIWTSLFIFLALINLINPEIREDQYHVDFPKMYLSANTIMIEPKEQLTVSGSPMLGEMYYTIGIFLWSQESARYIHFIFYILVLLTLFEFTKLNKHKFSIYTLLLFITAPVVIHETSSMYVDFEWIFCFLVSILILTQNTKITTKKIILSGLILGGMFASKMWTIVFIPVSTVYLFLLIKDSNLLKRMRNILIFLSSCIIVPFIWLLRSYLLTGTPIYPAFIKISTLENSSFQYGLSHYLGLNTIILNPLNFINVFSPLFFLGCLLIIYKFKENIKILISLNIFKYFLILFLVYISIIYPFGRYLLGLYVLFIFFSSIGLSKIIEDFKIAKYLINIFLVFFFAYYLINSLLILPYTFGIADKNKYLSRTLIRDSSSYYNYGNQFEKHITKSDYVATYKVFGYYYANFKYLDVNFVFNQNNKSFKFLKEKGFTKLLIKGGDINYFCKQINLIDCDKNSYQLISSYAQPLGYYLYIIK